MKNLIVLLLIIISSSSSVRAQNWNELFKQKKTQTTYSLMQIAKLQLYLNYVKSGYEIAKEGLTLVGDIKNGDFNLHDLFFSDLSRVKSSIKNYSKVSEIYTLQQQIRTKCQDQRRNWNNASSHFTADERLLLQRQQQRMLTALSDDLSALADVITYGQLQLSDDERIKRINLIYLWVAEKEEWTIKVGRQCLLLNAQRSNSLRDLNILKQLH